jgi:hypothetical protein
MDDPELRTLTDPELRTLTDPELWVPVPGRLSARANEQVFVESGSNPRYSWVLSLIHSSSYTERTIAGGLDVHESREEETRCFEFNTKTMRHSSHQWPYGVTFVAQLLLIYIYYSERVWLVSSAPNSGRLYSSSEGVPMPMRHVYSSCDDDTGLFTIDDVLLMPDKISRGTRATFRIRASMNDTGYDVEDGIVSMRVGYGPVQVFQEEDGVCDLAEACPIPRGGKEFDIVYVKDFPLITPPGKYVVELRGAVPGRDLHSSTRPLFCVRVGFRVAFW